MLLYYTVNSLLASARIKPKTYSVLPINLIILAIFIYKIKVICPGMSIERKLLFLEK